MVIVHEEREIMKHNHVGIDVSAKTFTTIIDHEGERTEAFDLANDPKGFKKLIKMITKKGFSAQVVLTDRVSAATDSADRQRHATESRRQNVTQLSNAQLSIVSCKPLLDGALLPGVISKKGVKADRGDYQTPEKATEI